MKVAQISRLYEKHKDRFVEEWKELLRIPSISGMARHRSDVMRCASWLKDQLTSIGLNAEFLETGVGPVVYGERRGNPEKPTVLLYGHYDLQPTGSLDQWESEPFTPVVREGRMYARGARDNKGQLFFNLKALETLIQENALDCTVKVFLEGEEESGSTVTVSHLAKWKKKISCDVVMASETNGMEDGNPAVIMGCRGVAFMKFHTFGPNRDIHSGHNGGIVRNPLIELSKAIASLYNDDGTIAVHGFLDDVEALSDEERELVASYPFNEEEYKAILGIDALGGEAGYSPLEQVGFRPVIEIPGIESGYVREGLRSIIPSTAFAQVIMRLARGQDPERCVELVESHIRERIPPGVRFEVRDRGIMCRALCADVNSSVIQKARGVLEEDLGFDVGYLWTGCTLPMITHIADCTGAEPLLVGFGQTADNEHGPNESFSLEQFKKGFLYSCALLSRL